MFKSKVRKRFIISLLMIFILAAFIYVRKETFLQQAKRLISRNLEKSLMCKFSFAEINPGVFGGLVLKDLEMVFPQSSGLIFKLQVEEAFIDYNLKEIFFSKEKKKVRSLRLISPTINVTYSQAPLEGLVPFENERIYQKNRPGFPRQDFLLFLENGEISVGKTRLLLKNLHGRLRLNETGLYLEDIIGSLSNSTQETFKLYGQLTSSGLDLTASFEHAKIGDFDILTNLSLNISKAPSLPGRPTKITGVFKTYGSVLNYQPCPELTSTFEIQGDRLRILSFSLGDSYDLRGVVNLEDPFIADLSLNFYQAPVADLVALFISPEEVNFSGLVNGLIRATGELKRLKFDGYLQAANGHFGKLDFVSADVNIEGRYPRILISDSRIQREQGVFFMEGEINLAQLEQQDALDVHLTADKGIVWQGWDITRSQEDQVHMSKDIPGDLKITFDAFMQDKLISYATTDRNELGLEYRIFGNKILKLRLKKDEGILGFERRVRF